MKGSGYPSKRLKDTLSKFYSLPPSTDSLFESVSNLPGDAPPCDPIYRVIDGYLYRRDTVPAAYDAQVHDLGHGQVEAYLSPRYLWSEVASVSPSALVDAEAAKGHIWVVGQGWVPYVPTAFDVAENARLNRERSIRRARTKVRRLCKNKGCTVMLTLTYRENMVDRSRMARDFDVFVKRLRRLLPDFQYVCCFEQQKRGAWHAHIAVPRLAARYLSKNILVRSYDLLRSMWRGVVGLDNGNIDVSRNKRVQRSPSRLASYLSKYIGKGFGSGLENGDSYRASGRALPSPARFVLPTVHGSEAVSDLLGSIFRPAGPGMPFPGFHHSLLDNGRHFLTLWPKGP